MIMLAKSAQSFWGTISMSSASIFTGSLSFSVRPSLGARRMTWVSTTIPEFIL